MRIKFSTVAQKNFVRLVALLQLSAALAVTLLNTRTVHAQWKSESITLQPGWNAVFLHVDASHESLESSVAADASNPIQEIWLWKAVTSPDRYIANPQEPVASADWSSWNRSDLAGSALARLVGNAAYLVRNGATEPYTWSVKGKPVPPSYHWTSKGVNLIGFSAPTNNPPFFSAFLAPVQRLASEGEFYRYDDGNNDLTPTLFNALFHKVPVKRGNAFWIRHENEFNSYFGAFEVVLQNSSGINFGASGSQYSLRLRNKTASELTLTLNLLASEAAPSGETAIAGTPPLLLRGSLNTTTLAYGSTDLVAAPHSVTLKASGTPGSEAELILGVNRTAMSGNPNDLFAGVLRLTDSAGQTQIDLPVSANPHSSAGLWVGNAIVNQVRHFLKTYERDADGKPVQNAEGKYVVTNTVSDLGDVARPFNLRLIVHNSSREARLLQRVYHGLNVSSNLVVATRENFVHPSMLANARRISAAHLPFTESNAGWLFTGQFSAGNSVVAQVALSSDDYASNPFLHSFHPDHDNLNATFDAAEPRGSESYDVQRAVTLTFAAPGTDFASLVAGGNQLIGQYAEQITFKGHGDESLNIDTAGSFVLRRISETATLTTQ